MSDADIAAALGLGGGGEQYDATKTYLYPYQELLTRDNYKKVDKIEEKMKANLDERIQLWVQDSTDIDPNDPDEPERWASSFFSELNCCLTCVSCRIPFVINATPKTTIDEIRVSRYARYACSLVLICSH
jgi:hypothetical protein